MLVSVLPPINAFAGRDTVVTIGQPLQLQASGGLAYEWLPADDLSAADIANPVALFNASTDGRIIKSAGVQRSQLCGFCLYDGKSI